MNLKGLVLVLGHDILIIPGAGVQQLALQREEVVLIIFWESPYFLLVAQACTDLIPSVSGADLCEPSVYLSAYPLLATASKRTKLSNFRSWSSWTRRLIVSLNILRRASLSYGGWKRTSEL